MKLTPAEIAAHIEELQRDQKRLTWFIRHLNLDARDCGCPPIGSVSMQLIANSDEDDSTRNLRQLIDGKMKEQKQ